MKINGTYSKLLTLLAGVPQGSILGPDLFNVFINNSPHGYADDNTLCKVAESHEQLLKDLQQMLIFPLTG